MVGPTVAELEKYMFGLINQSRMAERLAPYTWNDTLARVAREHSNLLLKRDGCPDGHQCPGELDPDTRVRNAGVSFSERKENVGGRFGGSARNPFVGLDRIHQDDFIYEGPGGGHHDAIMSSTLEQVGVGVAFDANHIWVLRILSSLRQQRN
jgi:uncharacterized protein YkwD